MAKRQRRKYTDEYKAEAVRLVRESSLPVTQVARDLDLTESSLRNWIKRAEVEGDRGPAGPVSSTEQDELRRLRREVRQLRMEREILKKATAFFAKESG